LRQAFEQYCTWSQFLAQDLRQVISRPHTRHGLLGKYSLLPLYWDVGFIAGREW
jgi:hypothetical protein